MAGLVNGQFTTKSIPKTIVDKSATTGTRSVSYSYGTAVNQTDFNNKVLTGANPNQTAIDVYATTGTGRAAQSLGKVGTTTVAANGSTQFAPSGNFNKLPEAVRNDISSTAGQTAAKNAINGAAADAKLQNNLTSKAGSAPGSAAPAAAAGAAGAAPGVAPASAANLPGTGFGAETASGGGGRYPLRMKDDQDYVMFKSEKGGSVVIGIQPTIQDSNRQNWGESQLNPFQLAGLKSASRLVGAEDYAKQAGEEVTKLMDAFKAATGDPMMKQAAQTFFAAQAMSMDTNQLLARSDVGMGVIMNPNLELVYTGPSLRTFSYTFKMTPREADESKAIRNIINFFKSNMAPRASQMFFKRPYYFDIIYKGKGATSLNLIKERCALLECSVNYTPDGSYMTYEEDGSMTSFQVTLQFSETSPLTDKDYEGVNDGQIFY
jgi:hypothetical protein